MRLEMKRTSLVACTGLRGTRYLIAGVVCNYRKTDYDSTVTGSVFSEPWSAVKQ